ERDVCVRLTGRPLRALAVAVADLAGRELRSIECCLLRRGAGASSTSSSPSRVSSPEILAVTAENRPAAGSSGSAAVVRRPDIPMYQRAKPTSSTIAEVKNINGKR